MKQKLVITAVLLAAVILSLFFLPLGMSLLIKDKAGHVYYMKSISPGDTVSIGFKHSVEKVIVVDTFIVTANGELLLVNTTYGSMGAGLPSDQSYQITTENGNFSINNINTTFEKVNFMVVGFTQHYIEVSGEKYLLSGHLPEEKPLTASVERNIPVNMFLNTIRTQF